MQSHNQLIWRVQRGIRVGGKVGSDGYVVDFGDLKRAARVFCQSLNEYFIVPMKSEVLAIDCGEKSVSIVTERGETFMIPKGDCAMLPIAVATAEELAFLGWNQLITVLSLEFFQKRCVTWMEVSVFERPTQEARYRRDINAEVCHKTDNVSPV